MSWVEGNTFGVSSTASEGQGIIFVSTLAPQTVAQYPMATLNNGVPTSTSWNIVDASSLFTIPNDAKALQLTGILAITMGTAAETADIHIWAGPPSDPPANYVGQTLAVPASQGSRSNMQTWVKLENGKFAFAWWCASPQPFAYPDHACYIINLKPQAYIR